MFRRCRPWNSRISVRTFRHTRRMACTSHHLILDRTKWTRELSAMKLFLEALGIFPPKAVAQPKWWCCETSDSLHLRRWANVKKENFVWLLPSYRLFFPGTTAAGSRRRGQAKDDSLVLFELEESTKQIVLRSRPLLILGEFCWAMTPIHFLLLSLPTASIQRIFFLNVIFIEILEFWIFPPRSWRRWLKQEAPWSFDRKVRTSWKGAECPLTSVSSSAG